MKKIIILAILDYSEFWDELVPVNKDHKEKKDKPKKEKIKYAWCLKRLVSKKKRRLENEHFDLDLSYITKRVIAMGYPSTGFEALYRNSAADVQKFFETYHNNKVKVYNLCLEKDKIYPKEVFKNGVTVGLFPSKDHNPCPIK